MPPVTSPQTLESVPLTTTPVKLFPSCENGFCITNTSGDVVWLSTEANVSGTQFMAEIELGANCTGFFQGSVPYTGPVYAVSNSSSTVFVTTF
jgi:hypothetical protein